MTEQLTAPRPHAKKMTLRKKAWIAGAVVATAMVVATGVNVYRFFAPAKFPQGVHPVAVYTVVDELTTSGANGNHLLGMCDADSYYIKVDSAEMCVTLNGSLGTVQANGTKDGIVLDANATRAVQELVRKNDDGNPTQVLLQYGGSPVAVVATSVLAAGGPVTATTLG
jgi:hypothetical protein